MSEKRIFSQLGKRAFSELDSPTKFPGVSLITVGEAKGHNVQIDKKTLEQLLEGAKRFKNGVRANLGHFTGVENAFGYITNIRVEEDRLKGDLNLFEEHKDFKLISKQIRTIPDTMGFSVYFDGEDEKKDQEVNGVKLPITYARCAELYSVDLVPEPAANPSGIFSKKPVDIKQRGMHKPKALSDSDVKKMLDEHASKMCDMHKQHLSDISDANDKLSKKIESMGKNDTPQAMDDEPEDDDDKQAMDDEPEDDDDKQAMDEEGNGRNAPEAKKAPRAPSGKINPDERIPDKGMSRFNHNRVVKDVTDGLLKAFSLAKKQPPAASTASGPSDTHSFEATDKPKNFFQAYRKIRENEPSKIKALQKARKEHWELYKAYCQAQERGEDWTRQPLDEKDPTRLAQMIKTGKLI